MATAKSIIVFGATGGTGRQVVAQALRTGLRVTAVVRNPAAFSLQHPSLTIVEGDVLAPLTFEGALPGHDAVLSCLGTQQRVATTVYSQGTCNIMAAMHRAGVKRLLCLSAGAVEVPPLRASWLIRLVTRYVLQKVFRHLYADMLRMEALLQGEMNLNWTIIRPPRLVTGPRTGRYRVAVNQPLRQPNKISRADLADYMVQHLDDAHTYRATVELAY
ncbi:NAD(P)H-binding protein [Hymenobacter sp.]|uniref:NAD(P)-dependent oxidoreductase n=1 Tax=Hymenobacter sp. TaxID=1898978 RepID=UPI00286A5EF9|nr:NAD(P)H-binding protein [Hymenobacter sp.]